jgi:hypothetical protein
MQHQGPEVDPVIQELIEAHFPDIGVTGRGRIRSYTVEMSAILKSRLADELMEQYELEPVIHDEVLLRGQIAGRIMAAMLTHQNYLAKTPKNVAYAAIAATDALLIALKERPDDAQPAS